MDLNLCLVLFDRVLDSGAEVTHGSITVKPFKASEHAPEGLHIAGAKVPEGLEDLGWGAVPDQDRGIPGGGFVVLRGHPWLRRANVDDLVSNEDTEGTLRIYAGFEGAYAALYIYTSGVAETHDFRIYPDGMAIAVPLGIRADILEARIRVEVDIAGWASRFNGAASPSLHRSTSAPFAKQIRDLCEDMRAKGQLAETCRQRIWRFRKNMRQADLQAFLRRPTALEDFTANHEGEPFLVDPRFASHVVDAYLAEVDWGMHSLDEPTLEE